MDKKEVKDILKKTGLFLVGIFMVIWGYRANVEDKSEDEAKSDVEQHKGSPAFSTETDDTEESSGSQ